MSDKLSIESQLNSFISARNTEIDIRWKKVQIFFLINSGLIGIVMGSNLDINLKILSCNLGLIITVIWYAIQLEAQYAIDYWNNKIAKLEITGEVIEKGFEFKYPHEGFRYRYFSTHYLILVLITLFILGWFSLIIFYILKIL